MLEPDWWVDHAAHELHCGDRAFPCDRDVEAMAIWEGHALLLSSDTDCLSLWDCDGLVRTVRAGVYPQDMAVEGDAAAVCGGTDGCVHLFSLPDLQPEAVYPLPGMPERIALTSGTASILTLLTEPEVHTALLSLDLARSQHRELARFPGIPGSLTADGTGLWVAVSEQLLHFPRSAEEPDVLIHGLGLIRQIRPVNTGYWLSDALEDTEYLLYQRADGQWALLPCST